MLPKLSEFEEITDGEWKLGGMAGKKPSEEELTRCLQALMTRQCIYSSTPGLGRTYEILKAYFPFFEGYVGCMGYRLVQSPKEQMVAISVPYGQTRYDASYQRMQKEQILVLLCLRLMRDEGISNQDVLDGGIVETTTADLVDRIKSVTQVEPPSERDLLDALKFFQKYGGVRVGERDRVEKVSPISILPGVNVIAPDIFVDDLKLWAASSKTPEANQNTPKTEEDDLVEA